MYIRYGPPDVLVSHPAGEPLWTPFKDAPDNVKYSWENWHYSYIEGLGQMLILRLWMLPDQENTCYASDRKTKTP
jgi:hypothetical protein